MMIDEQGPVIQPHEHLRRLQIILGLLGNRFKQACQIVAKNTYRTTGKRKFATLDSTGLVQTLAQQIKGIRITLPVDLGVPETGHSLFSKQRGIRVAHQDIPSPLLWMCDATIKPHRPGTIDDASEKFRYILGVRQFGKNRGRHRTISIPYSTN